jgi:hypothetical protein
MSPVKIPQRSHTAGFCQRVLLSSECAVLWCAMAAWGESTLYRDEINVPSQGVDLSVGQGLRTTLATVNRGHPLSAAAASNFQMGGPERENTGQM